MHVTRVEGEAAVVVEDSERYLIVSDVHLGYEEELLRAGIHVPPQYPKMVRQLEGLIESCNPDALVFLGDLKHRIAGVSWREAKQVREVIERLRGLVGSIIITPGNHDVGVYSLVGGMADVMPSRGFSTGRAWLLHGHTWPLPEALSHRVLIIGHTHPSILLREEEAKVRLRVFMLAETERRALARCMSQRPGYEGVLSSYSLRGRVRLLIMPHFNHSMSGIDVRSLAMGRAASPLLRSGAFNLEQAEVVMLDGVNLGRVCKLSAEEGVYE